MLARSVLSPVQGKVNRPFQHETAPSITADNNTLFFLRQNPNKEGASERDDWDIFYSKRINGVFSDPIPVRSVNTDKYEGFPSISADGRTLFFSSENGTEYKDKDIFYSRYENGKWSAPQNMGPNINFPGLDEIGGSISPNGQIFVFFARDRDDSLGKTDIYISYRQADGSWSPAKNMGRPVNSRYTEYAPYIAADGRTLYFSSDRRGGFGGQDLYKSVLTRKRWSKPVNLGRSVNTKGDDISISIPAKGDIFYTSSQLRGGSWDILTGILPARYRPFKVNLLVGKVFDSKTKKPILAKVLIEDLDSGRPIGSYDTQKDDGSFTVSLLEGTRYSFTVEAENYLLFNQNYNLKKTGKYREVHLNIPLEKIEKGASVVINNIFFKPNSAALSRDSRLALDRLAKLLKKHYRLALEIRGHTDDIGPEKRNMQLSLKRAESVRRYLMKKGISGVRLKAIGFGETKPLVKNNSAKNRAKNRRIEFKVIQN